jgi:hypothetical protein
MRQGILTTSVLSVILGACSTATDIAAPAVPATASSPIATSSVNGPERGTPVVVGRRARVYVVAGFKEADCSAVTPDIKISSKPGKGDVSLEPNQTTAMQFSQTGKCTGKPMAGTGIYYTARAGTAGNDTFTITAATGTGTPMTKTFTVRIVE